MRSQTASVFSSFLCYTQKAAPAKMLAGQLARLPLRTEHYVSIFCRDSKAVAIFNCLLLLTPCRGNHKILIYPKEKAKKATKNGTEEAVNERLWLKGIPIIALSHHNY